MTESELIVEAKRLRHAIKEVSSGIEDVQHKLERVISSVDAIRCLPVLSDLDGEITSLEDVCWSLKSKGLSDGEKI